MPLLRFHCSMPEGTLLFTRKMSVDTFFKLSDTVCASERVLQQTRLRTEFLTKGAQ